MPVCIIPWLTRSLSGYIQSLSVIPQVLSSLDGPAITRPRLDAEIASSTGKANVFGRSPRPERLPITPSILRAIKSVLSSSATEHDTIMNRAICTLAFFRLGEILLTTANFDPKRHLAVGDVAVDSWQKPSLLRVHLKCSKTDQLRKGVDIYGKTGDDICSVTAVLSFLAIRGQKPGTLFVCCDSTLCTKGRFIPKLWSGLQEAGLVGPNFAGHSFRIGAAERSIEDSTIKPWGDGTPPHIWLTYA